MSEEQAEYKTGMTKERLLDIMDESVVLSGIDTHDRNDLRGVLVEIWNLAIETAAKGSGQVFTGSNVVWVEAEPGLIVPRSENTRALVSVESITNLKITE